MYQILREKSIECVGEYVIASVEELFSSIKNIGLWIKSYICEC